MTEDHGLRGARAFSIRQGRPKMSIPQRYLSAASACATLCCSCSSQHGNLSPCDRASHLVLDKGNGDPGWIKANLDPTFADLSKDLRQLVCKILCTRAALETDFVSHRTTKQHHCILSVLGHENAGLRRVDGLRVLRCDPILTFFSLLAKKWPCEIHIRIGTGAFFFDIGGCFGIGCAIWLDSRNGKVDGLLHGHDCCCQIQRRRL